MQFWNSFCHSIAKHYWYFLKVSFICDFTYFDFFLFQVSFNTRSFMEKGIKRHQVLQKVHQEHLILSHLTCVQKRDLKFLYKYPSVVSLSGRVAWRVTGWERRALSGPVSDITIISQSQPVVRPSSPLDMCHCPIGYGLPHLSYIPGILKTQFGSNKIFQHPLKALCAVFKFCIQRLKKIWLLNTDAFIWESQT